MTSCAEHAHSIGASDDPRRVNFESPEYLVDHEMAHRLRLLKADLDGEPLDLDAPAAVDIYDGDAKTATPETAGDDTQWATGHD